LILVLRLVELFKNSKQDQTHNEPHANFLQHIAIQKETFAGLIRELKRIAIPKYLILLLGFFNSEELIYFINPFFWGVIWVPSGLGRVKRFLRTSL
jgi:hypothetical protein